jgi:hypothetical protein
MEYRIRELSDVLPSDLGERGALQDLLNAMTKEGWVFDSEIHFGAPERMGYLFRKG